MDRARSLQRLINHPYPWDLLIVGGGATGVAIAMDAASRGFDVCLLEQSDFGKGTSSRSTKLIHGGVRYLQQGNVSLVMEALKERGILRRNAPHIVHDLAFVVPNYEWWEAPFYGIGMKVYDLLAFRYGFGKSRRLSREEVLRRIPTLEEQGLRGGVLYFDGQFDDSRLLIAMARTADRHGAALLNYAPVRAMEKDDDGFIDRVIMTDLETGREHVVRGRYIINATGPFADALRRLDDPSAPAMIAPSQGVHLVLDRALLPGDAAIMVPRTSDGRVMFAIPWHQRTLLGTTDTPIEQVDLEPVALDSEIDFLLETAARYLARRPTRSDIRSIFTGIRPLVKASEAAGTAALSRDHTIQVSASGLLTIAGGKWTTCRRMAEDCVDHAIMLGRLEERPCVTHTLQIHGYTEHVDELGHLAEYGSDAVALLNLINARPELGEPLHPSLPIVGAEVVWAVREEMARTVDDTLARRSRALLLDAAATIDIAPRVASLMAGLLDRNAQWEQQQVEEFLAIAQCYVPRLGHSTPGTR